MGKLYSILAGGFVAIVLALGAGPAAAVPGTGNGQGNGPPFDIVRGGGEFPFVTPFGRLQVAIQADGIKKKGVASGSFSATIRGIVNIDISGSITCLEVDGSSVVLSGIVEQTNSGIAPIGSGVIAMGIDNGAPGPDGTPVDTVLALPQGRPLYTCPEPLSAGVQLTKGDFVTHDGDFRTQGQLP
jgi:hypothetical protein